MMDPEVKTKWLAALRSGKYPQGVGKLRRKDGNQHCCLGVLCEVAVEAGVIQPAEFVFGVYRYGKDHDADLLPREVGLWAGIDYRDPPVVTNEAEGRKDSLSVINDSMESFEAIAGYIEKSL